MTIPFFAFAETILESTDESSELTGISAGGQQIGNGIDYDIDVSFTSCTQIPNWEIESIKMKLKNQIFNDAVVTGYVKLGSYKFYSDNTETLTDTYAEYTFNFATEIDILQKCIDLDMGSTTFKITFGAETDLYAFKSKLSGSPSTIIGRAVYQGGSPDADYYITVTGDSNEIPGSFIDLNYPGQDETVATTTVEFSANYWNIDNYTQAGFRITQQDNYFETTYLQGSTTDGQGSFSTTTVLQAGAYMYQAFMTNSTTTTTKWSDDIFTFYVLSNPYLTATTTLVDTDFNCDDMGTIAGAFCAVFVKLFKPDPENMARFAQLKDLIEEKPPFAYFTSIKNEYDDLGASTTPAFVLQQVGSINTTVFDPLRNGLTWILWIFFGFYVVKRVSGYVL